MRTPYVSPGPSRGPAWVLPSLLGLCLLLPATGCSIKKVALKGVAGSLSAGGDTFSSDDDPELIRDATPFALKTVESLLSELPEHEGLLLSACRGFTQYAYAFIQLDADYLEEEDYTEAVRMRERALRMYIRARDYGLRALEVPRPGIGERLRLDPEAAVLEFDDPAQVPALYWTAASWGAAIALAKDRPDLVADLSAVIAIARRCLVLDESFEQGAVHDILITLESLPANMGGSLDRARNHFHRALALSGSRKAGTFVTMASGVSVASQNQAEFVALLQRALKVDPDAYLPWRLQNLIAQRRARLLLSRTDELFFDEEFMP